MNIKIVEYIEKFKILGENHFGFRSQRSTVDTLVNVVENIRLEMVRKHKRKREQ